MVISNENSLHFKLYPVHVKTFGFLAKVAEYTCFQIREWDAHLRPSI